METVKGYVDHIIYRNADNGYTVLVLGGGEEELTCVGVFSDVTQGENIEATGKYTAHPTYGRQFKVSSFVERAPEDAVAIERYLGSGAIKGIGAALAARIVRRFQDDTFRIMEEEPERLAEVKGISKRMAMEIADQVNAKKDLRQAMIFLQQYGIHTSLAVKIYKAYGQEIYRILKENPYRMADDIEGVGFRTADEIAIRAGIRTDSDFRIRSGILYTLLQAAADGHTYLPMPQLTERTSSLLGIDSEYIEPHYMNLAIDRKIVMVTKEIPMEAESRQHQLDGTVRASEDLQLWEDAPDKEMYDKEMPDKEISDKEVPNREVQVYSAAFYYKEANSATLLRQLDVAYDIEEEEIRSYIRQIEKKIGIQLEEHQAQAVIEAARNGLFILTGGPGTGKTTTINAIIRYFEMAGMDIYLAAPTGRAAKRMTETTGVAARTIHRMLEVSGEVEEHAGFERNEMNPLETDVIIIDEMSMVDINLMYSLLKAISPGTRLILVGDVNQLPSVGPGSVLKDMIDSGKFHMVQLEKIFRQASTSDIIVNAHKINHGEAVSLDNKSRDFFFLKRYEADKIINVMLQLIKQMLPKYVDAGEYDIQVLTPMRKGLLGVERLNGILQQYLNPPDPGKREREYGDRVFREGDKVMQVKNNYQMEWEIVNRYGLPLEKGNGIFNGDIGIIEEINTFAEHMVISFDEGKRVEYPFKQLEELELAYAITIHKSQGSEYPAVVIPLLTGPRMLLNRNLLYTAVTRAKKCVTIVGDDRTFQAMIDNNAEQKRYSGLRDRLVEL